MQTVVWAAIAVVVLAVLGFAIVYAVQRQRSERLRARFGPEYDRTVEAVGDRRRAEQELAAREERRRRFQIRELEPADRERYREAWQRVQAHFVDRPAAALGEADGLVTDVMRRRGYPMDDFDQAAADVSVDHPREVEDYRMAHAATAAAERDETNTEDMRLGIRRYRSLFSSLVGEDPAPDRPDAMPAGEHGRDGGQEHPDGREAQPERR
jgi:hypothetical protein